MPSERCCRCSTWIKKPNRRHKRKQCNFLCERQDKHFLCRKCEKASANDGAASVAEPREDSEWDNLFTEEFLQLLQSPDAESTPELPLPIAKKRGRPLKDPSLLKPNSVYKKMKLIQCQVNDQIEQMNATSDLHTWPYLFKAPVEIISRKELEECSGSKFQLLVKKISFVKLKLFLFF